MHDGLREAIADFRRSQELALTYLHGRLGLSVPQSNVHWAVTARQEIQGILTIAKRDGVVLRKHGYGIEVIHPDFRIDFDYGPCGECDRFDAWRLALHRHCKLAFPSPVEGQREFTHWLADAHAAGELVKLSENCSGYVDPSNRSNWRHEPNTGG